MKLIFISNIFNHYQKSVCDEWYELLGDEFKFIATQELSNERQKLGWTKFDDIPYLINAYESVYWRNVAHQLAYDSDVLVIGSAPESYANKRIKENKLVIRYSERFLKEGYLKLFHPRIAWKYYNLHTKNRNKNVYLLCASAYASADYKKIAAYKGKAYKWGYFSEPNHSSFEELVKKKENNNVVNLIWVGRFVWWKHPKLVIKAAKKLKDRALEFKVTMVGSGPQENILKRMVEKYGLEKQVIFTGGLSPQKVIEKMDNASIFLFTSDFREGWGVVLNEAMNSGCAVIASHAAGSTPYLIENGRNGYIYKSGSFNDFIAKLEKLLADRELQSSLGFNAYKTIEQTWNPKTAAHNAIELFEGLLKERCIEIEDGPCSIAMYVRNNWIKGQPSLQRGRDIFKKGEGEYEGYSN